MQRLLPIILMLTLGSAAHAVSFCQFYTVNCPEGTSTDMACYKQICNGVVSKEIKMFTRQEIEQFRFLFKSQTAETADEICRRITAVNPLDPKEKSEAIDAQKFATCLRRYGPTKH